MASSNMIQFCMEKQSTIALKMTFMKFKAFVAFQIQSKCILFQTSISVLFSSEKSQSTKETLASVLRTTFEE